MEEGLEHPPTHTPLSATSVFLVKPRSGSIPTEGCHAEKMGVVPQCLLSPNPKMHSTTPQAPGPGPHLPNAMRLNSP